MCVLDFHKVSQRFQECNQRLLVLGRQIEPEAMALHRAGFQAISDVACRHVIVVQPSWIEPVLERCDGAVVLERTAIPDATE